MQKIITNPLSRHVLAHGIVALFLVCTLALTEAWEQTGSNDYLSFMAAVWAFLCGFGLSHIIHEWCHYAGARLARSVHTLKPQTHPLFFDFNLEANSPGQFLCLSLGGLVGNLLLLALLLSFPTTGSIVMTGLLASVVGQFVFVLMLELPISVEVIAGKVPLAAITDHFEQGAPLFLRAALGGVGAAVLVFLIY
jgi:hypothetical protein